MMNISHKGRLQGGSTIPEQLVKMRWPAIRHRNLGYRVLRAVVGVWLTIRMGRQSLLCDYLNEVYLGRKFFGIEAAARGYFGCCGSDISRAQALFLAERIALPNAFRPERISNMLRRPLVRGCLGANLSELPPVYEFVFGSSARYVVADIVGNLSKL